MDPILEYLFKIAPVVGVMGLWIFFNHKQMIADKKTIAKQNEEYKELLERVITVSNHVLENSLSGHGSIKTDIINEIQGLKSFIELKFSKLKNDN